MTSYLKLFFFLTLFTVNSLLSQTALPNKEYYKLYDSINQYQNIGVFNGLEYVDIYNNFKRGNHKFYLENDFLIGDIVYDGQPYYGYKMKYDLLNDFLLIEFINLKINYLSLNAELVNGFLLNNERFVRLSYTPDLNGFYRNGFFKEVLKGNKYVLYVKLMKQKTERFRDAKSFYLFKEENIYVLQTENKFYRINKINDIFKIFPEHKKRVQDFHEKYKRLYEIDKEEFFKKLFKVLDDYETNSVIN